MSGEDCGVCRPEMGVTRQVMIIGRSVNNFAEKKLNPSNDDSLYSNVGSDL